MRMSCNGCRVLRKGCSESCSIRPCLDWIKNPDAQANATVFLAKFYGRAGLMNHINAGPHHLRPGIFRSLLYDACGRIVNPIYGSVGLLWSGSWKLCEEAVEAVLKGSPITPMESDVAHSPPLKAYDIRHVNNKGRREGGRSKTGLNRVRTRGRFKRSKRNSAAEVDDQNKLVEQQGNASPSHDSSLSEQRNESLGSPGRSRDGEIELELSLGWFKPVKMCLLKPKELKEGVGECNNGLFDMGLGLQS